MGIKGISKEIGLGRRVALAKLATENYEKTGRPLRIAVDVSIWQFQIQSGKGGSNPALRTLYYRFLRLLSLNIQPLFIFDGSRKPPIKRNKRTGVTGPSLIDMKTKDLLKLFGFPFHVAPGEAEAECALLQREGIVDAVLSEDIDTLMFGCNKTLRDWSPEEPRGKGAPTHVSVYDTTCTNEGISGLDREGMILVALLSGGDYITEGVPGFGIKIACEAARAGLGKSLCRLSTKDTKGLEKWRENLINELQTNNSMFFRVKHTTLQIPENFPDKEVLGYYTHPVVSSATKLAEMRTEIKWDMEVDVKGLRLFVAETFEWTCKTGAKRFIRGLAPALLTSKLLARGDYRASEIDSTVHSTIHQTELVKEICGRRRHFSTDGLSELHLVYRPDQIVGLDLDAEVDGSEDFGRSGLAPIDEAQNLQAPHFDTDSDTISRKILYTPKRRVILYDPTEFHKVWVPETIAKIGIPLIVEDYEEVQRSASKINKQKTASKNAPKKTTGNGGMPKGALDRYFTTAKPAVEARNSQSSKQLQSFPQDVPPRHLTPILNDILPSCKSSPQKDSQSEARIGNMTLSGCRGKQESVAEEPKPQTSVQKKGLTSNNPWAIAQSSSPASQESHFPTVGISKPGVHGKTTTACQIKSFQGPPGFRGDRVGSQTLSPPPPGKHCRPISSSSNEELPLVSSKNSQLFSPTKKRIPKASTRAIRDGANSTKQKATVQDIIDISSSPISETLSALVSEKRTDGCMAKNMRKPVHSRLEVYQKTENARFVVARDSLEGTWKEVDQEPARGLAWRLSGIDVLDMTGD